MSQTSSQAGITLIEMILVAAIIMMLAAVAVPSLLRTKQAADSAVAIGQLRTMHTTQTMYKLRGSRFARLPDLNTFVENSLGTTVGSTIRHRSFTFLMSPTPTNSSLRTGYTIYAYRIEQGRVISFYRMSEMGAIETIIP